MIIKTFCLKYMSSAFQILTPSEHRPIFILPLQNRVAEIGAYIGKRGLISRTPSHAGNNPTAARREDSEEQRQPLAAWRGLLAACTTGVC